MTQKAFIYNQIHYVLITVWKFPWYSNTTVRKINDYMRTLSRVLLFPTVRKGKFIMSAKVWN